MIHVKLRDSRGPCRDYVGILIFFVKNYVIHVKLRDSRKTTWFIKNSLITFSLNEIAPIFGYIFIAVGMNTIDIHEKHDLNWEITYYILVPTWCVLYRFNSFSPGQKAIHVGITRGFMKAPGFRPSPEWALMFVFYVHLARSTIQTRPPVPDEILNF